MKNTTFVLVALVAMIGTVFGMAPLQLSGETGKNISMNLTDDTTFMAVEYPNGTSYVIVIDTDELTQYVMDINMINSSMDLTKY